MSIFVRYSDVAIGAKQAFDPSTQNEILAKNADFMKQDVSAFKRYDLPFEINSFILDGGAEFLPEDSEPQTGFIYDVVSNESGDFENNVPVLRMIADEKYSSIGITIRFDDIKNIYATHLQIRWYREGILIDSEDFYPDSALYFCSKKVEYFDEVEITAYSLNLPETRFRINSVDFGIVTDFSERELRSAKIIQEISPISTSVPANVFDFTVDSQKGLEFSFQEHQPISLYFNGQLLSTTFVKTATRKSKNLWSIQSEDYIWIMDTVYFKGDLYSKKKASDLLKEIFDTAKVKYTIESSLDDVFVSGYIPFTTCREALMQVLFATQTVADTSGSGFVRVFSLSDEVSQTIHKNRIMQGQSFQGDTRVSSVEIAYHGYIPLEDTSVVYNSEESGVGNDILVPFKEPMHSLYIKNGTIKESGVNYAIIDAQEGCELSGKIYNHTTSVKTKKNPLVLTTDVENIVAVENGTLITSANVDKVLEKCYNYFVNTNSTNMKIVDGAGDGTGVNYYGYNLYGKTTYGTVNMSAPPVTAVGDLIKYETEYFGNKIGRIIKQSYSIVGNIIVKDSVLR